MLIQEISAVWAYFFQMSANLVAAKWKFWAEIPGKLPKIPGKWAEIPVRQESNLQFVVNLA